MNGQPQANPLCNLSMPLADCNTILNALSALPWRDSNALIATIHNQLREQLNPVQNGRAPDDHPNFACPEPDSMPEPTCEG
jgi:hypothetical protein